MSADGAVIIGTRQPSPEQELLAGFLANQLSAVHGIRIRTGGAFGIDAAAMRGALARLLDVFLPWASYNQEIIPAGATRRVYDPARDTTWTESVSIYHPNPRALTRGARALHARNYGIVYGSKLVIAFPNETGQGGTGQGLRIADDLGIPILQYDKGAPLPSLVEGVNAALAYLFD